MILAGVSNVRNTADTLQVSTAVSHVSTSLLLHQATHNQLPDPDVLYFLEFDTALDTGDPKMNIDAVYKTWPILNKLVAHSGLQLDFELLQGDSNLQRLADVWEQDIRYVLGSGLDDNGLQPEGSFTDWNWDPHNKKALKKGYPYVYSYGLDNIDGTQKDRWIYQVGNQ